MPYAIFFSVTFFRGAVNRFFGQNVAFLPLLFCHFCFYRGMTRCPIFQKKTVQEYPSLFACSTRFLSDAAFTLPRFPPKFQLAQTLLCPANFSLCSSPAFSLFLHVDPKAAPPPLHGFGTAPFKTPVLPAIRQRFPCSIAELAGVDPASEFLSPKTKRSGTEPVPLL